MELTAKISFFAFLVNTFGKITPKKYNNLCFTYKNNLIGFFRIKNLILHTKNTALYEKSMQIAKIAVRILAAILYHVKTLKNTQISTNLNFSHL